MKYLPNAPDILIYDFACQLSEFATNREPKHFENTEFYHDVFHSVNHVCPYAFQCQSIEKQRCYNTSVCEQFNRYFNLIQKTGRSLRMSRFALFAQHMIYEYNKDRNEFCNRKRKGLKVRCGPNEKQARLADGC